jgi:hypothetical protein
MVPDPTRGNAACQQRREGTDATEVEVRAAVEQIDPLRDALFPAGQARILQRPIEQVDIGGTLPTGASGWMVCRDWGAIWPPVRRPRHERSRHNTAAPHPSSAGKPEGHRYAGRHTVHASVGGHYLGEGIGRGVR